MSLPVCLCVRHSADGEGVKGEHLHVRRAELAQELSSLQLAIAQLEADAGRLQNDITKKGVACFLIAKQNLKCHTEVGEEGVGLHWDFPHVIILYETLLTKNCDYQSIWKDSLLLSLSLFPPLSPPSPSSSPSSPHCLYSADNSIATD